MEKTRYAVWFLSTVALAIAALAAFNAAGRRLYSAPSRRRQRPDPVGL